MKKRSAIIISTLFTAGLIGVNNNIAQADVVKNSSDIESNNQITQSSNQVTTSTQTTSNSIQNGNSAEVANTNNSESSNSNQSNPDTNNQKLQTVNSNFSGEIKYIKNYGINVWNIDSNKNLTFTGNRIQDGTAVDVNSYTDLEDKNIRMYNIGSGWIDGQYLVNTQTGENVIAKPPYKGNITKDEFSGKINYIDGYSINIWYINNDQTLTFTGKRVKDGASVNVKAYVDLNNIRLYNIGTNQWIDGQYLINTQTNENAIAKPPYKGKVTDSKFSGKINYIDGYSINIWYLNSDQSLTFTGKRIKDGETVNVNSYVDLKDRNLRLYNIGKNEWIDGQYLTNTNQSAQDDNAINLPSNAYAVISYIPNYGIALWNENVPNQLTFSGRYLYNGTTWRAWKKKEFNNKLFYNVGTNQWIPAENAILYTRNNTIKVLKNDANSQEYYTSQYQPVWAPWGCASAALSMLMKYDGSFNNIPGSTEAAKLKYMQDHLPRNKAEGGQDGNPYNGAGFTRVILSNRLAQYAHELGDSKIQDISGASLSTIAGLVQAGHPVLYYGWSSYNGNGRGSDPYTRNHCKVIFGYNPANNTFLVHDPLYRYNHFTRGGGGQREGIYNGYDLGPISWVSAQSINQEFACNGGNNALTIQ